MEVTIFHEALRVKALAQMQKSLVQVVILLRPCSPTAEFLPCYVVLVIN